MPLMSMNEKLPTPSEKYKTLQQLLTQAIDARPRRSDETEINLRSLLKKEFEKAFNLQIPDEDAEKIGTVGDAVKYLAAKAK